jgi:hypothetical protein
MPYYLMLNHARIYDCVKYRMYKKRDPLALLRNHRPLAFCCSKARYYTPGNLINGLNGLLKTNHLAARRLNYMIFTITILY